MTSRSPPARASTALNTRPNIPAADSFYQELVDLHRSLSQEQSALVNAKLILLLANHIGDLAVLREAMRAARQDIDSTESAGGERAINAQISIDDVDH